MTVADGIERLLRMVGVVIGTRDAEREATI
jgi:hypothetical protein